MSKRLTKQIDLEELGYDYVLIDETKQPSANYKLGEYENIDTDPKHLTKIKQAFEILKEKQIDVLYIAMSHSLEQYNKHVSFIHNEWCLTQEEFDLLKEVLK